MAFNFLSWLDSGAPTMTGQNGSVTNSGNTGVADWALVTKGGWTKSQTAASSSVFTPVTGNTVLYLSHDSAVTGSAKLCLARAGESASGVGSANLTNPFPTVAQVADASCCWSVSNSADATARPYYILVTDSWAFFWFGYLYGTGTITTATGAATHFYGKFAPAISSDTFNTCISVAQNAANTVTGACALANYAAPTTTAAAIRCFTDRSFDGSVFSVASTVNTGAGGVGNPTNQPVYPNAQDGKLHMQKLAITDSYSATATSGAKILLYRGWIPNIWTALDKQGGTLANSKTFVSSGYNGATLFIYLMDTGQTLNCVVETTNTWAIPGV